VENLPRTGNGRHILIQASRDNVVKAAGTDFLPVPLNYGAMPEKINSRLDDLHQTPEQQDYRGHMLFDRRTGQKKEKQIRRHTTAPALPPYASPRLQQ
jgi:hypothetical protein